MGAKHKKWSEADENKFLDAYYVQRTRGVTKHAAKIQAQEKAISEDQRYSESSLKSRLALPQFVLDQVDVIDHQVSEKKGWINPRVTEAMLPPEPVAAAPVNPLDGVKPLPMDHHFLRSPAQILMEYHQASVAEMTTGLRSYILAELEVGFNQILDFLTDPSNPDAGDIPKTIQEIRNRKKIVVVGLYPNQFQVITRQFPKSRIIHIQAQEISNHIAAMSYADHVIVMTDFVGHDTSNLVKKYAKDRMIYCPGMVSKLTAMLSTFLNLEPKK